MSFASAPLANAVGFLTSTRLSHRDVAHRSHTAEDEVRRVAGRLLHLGLARDELARLTAHELNRLLRRRARRHVHRSTGGAAW